MKTITSRQHAFVTRCRTAARGRSAGAQEILLDGVHLVRDALEAGIAIRSAAVTAAAQRAPEMAALAKQLAAGRVELFAASEAVMDAASPARTPAGVIALADPPRAGLADVFARQPALVVSMHFVQDPGNVGAIVRAAEAAGATGVVAMAGCADPFGWKALRGAMGSAFRLVVAHGVAWADLAGAARASGARILAAVPRGGDELYRADLREPTVLLMGGEGAGLDDEMLAAADGRVRIPMAAGIESLNVAVAAGVLLFEARRQRTAGPPGGQA